MRVIRCALCALATLGAASAVSADFSWEIGGLVDHSDQSEDPGETETDFYGLSAAYYFDPVEDGSEPYALAAFFNPATRLSLSTSENRETDRVDGVGTSSEAEREISDYSLSGAYLLSRSRWYAGGRYSRGDVDEPNPPYLLGLPFVTVVSSTELEAYGLVAGKYLGSGATRLQLSLDRTETTNETSVTYCPLTCLTFDTIAESISETARLDVLHVRRFRSATYALLGGIGETQARVKVEGGIQVQGLELEPFRTYSVGAELYPVPAIGVRLGYTRFDEDFPADEEMHVGASWFFRPHIGVELTLSREDFEVLSRREGVSLRVIGRL